MFDFGSSSRREGNTPHINDKGLVSYDRKICKDAFYLYKANWNKAEKTTHLCSKRYTDRIENRTDIIAFTTAPSARLFINGKLIGKMETDKYLTVIWKDIKLNTGTNHVEIITVVYFSIEATPKELPAAILLGVALHLKDRHLRDQSFRCSETGN